MNYYIRRATDNDQHGLLLLMQAHAKYEGHQLDLSTHHHQSHLKA
jgi:hypothetical protein